MRKLGSFLPLIILLISPTYGQSKGEAQSEANGIYYGRSSQGKENIAWLLRLNFTASNGVIYSPPKVLKILNLKKNGESKISFQTESDAGTVMKFLGVISQDDIKGAFTSYREVRGNLEFLFENQVTFRMIRQDTGNICEVAEKRGYCGKYSNVKYNEESGDLNGLELVIVPTPSGTYYGVLTSYLDGGMPSPMERLTIRGTKITFTIKSEDDHIRYEGELMNGRLIINEFRPWARPIKQRMTLKTISSLDRLFVLPKSHAN